MPKYRLLTNDELHQFEKEFIEFLVVNGIEPDKWEKVKESDQASVDKIIELFSDVILESVLRNINFIQTKTKSYVQAIHCLPDKMISIAIEDSAKKTQPSQKLRSIKKSAKSEKKTKTLSDDNPLSIYKTEQEYKGSRESVIFDFLQKGYQISDGTLFKTLQVASV